MPEQKSDATENKDESKSSPVDEFLSSLPADGGPLDGDGEGEKGGEEPRKDAENERLARLEERLESLQRENERLRTLTEERTKPAEPKPSPKWVEKIEAMGVEPEVFREAVSDIAQQIAERRATEIVAQVLRPISSRLEGQRAMIERYGDRWPKIQNAVEAFLATDPKLREDFEAIVTVNPSAAYSMALNAYLARASAREGARGAREAEAARIHATLPDSRPRPPLTERDVQGEREKTLLERAKQIGHSTDYIHETLGKVPSIMEHPGLKALLNQYGG